MWEKAKWQNQASGKSKTEHNYQQRNQATELVQTHSQHKQQEPRRQRRSGETRMKDRNKDLGRRRNSWIRTVSKEDCKSSCYMKLYFLSLIFCFFSECFSFCSGVSADSILLKLCCRFSCSHININSDSFIGLIHSYLFLNFLWYSSSFWPSTFIVDRKVC